MSTEPTVCPKCNGSGVYVGEMGVTLDCEQCSGAASSTDPAPRDDVTTALNRLVWDALGEAETDREVAAIIVRRLTDAGYVLVRGEGLQHGDELEQVRGTLHGKTWRRRA